VADFRLLLKAVQWERETPRDSRWGQKYLPAPIGVFLAPSDTASGLLPLAIQIDQPQPNSEYNPVYTPDDGWGWIIAKAYFEAADVTWQSGFGHVFSTHLVMEPFCMATPRQLPPRHPVRLLLQPHTRFTLTTNQAGYRYLIDRSKLYNEIYTATLEQLRTVAIQAYIEHGFIDLQLEADLARRGVQDAPACYPYRDDLRLWLKPIQDFVRAYVETFYSDDAAVQADDALRAWKEELTDPARGAVRELVPGDRLDSRQKLVDLLAQVLFTAGPGHASQHFSAVHYYRYTPTFPAAAYAPPPRRSDPLDFAAWLSMLPSIDRASDQFRSNTFTNYRYDRFGSYGRFPLGSLPQVRQPIARLQADLADVERVIQQRQATRLFPYEFALPSRVPNSINI
jgi:arachidonate 15-lipoxygenase